MSERNSKTAEEIRNAAIRLTQSTAQSAAQQPNTTQTRSITPAPQSIGSFKLEAPGLGTVEFKKPLVDKIKWFVIPIVCGALGIGGGAKIISDANNPEPQTEVAQTLTGDPCPPKQPPNQRTPLCLKLMASESAVNSMSWELEELKIKVNRLSSLQSEVVMLREEVKKSIPRVEGLPVQQNK